MSAEYSIREAQFQHLVLEGTSYEVGRWQAEVARQRATPPHIPLSLDYQPRDLGFRDLAEMQELIESTIFDVTAGHVEVCFGAPTHNQWRTFTPFGGTGGTVQEYSAVFPSKQG